MRILLQFPEGLKQNAIQYAKALERKGHEVFLSASPCFGACDLAIDEALAIKADKIIHYGHAEFVRSKLPVKVEYLEYPIAADLAFIAKAKNELNGIKAAALATTVQYVRLLPKVKKSLEKFGVTVRLAKGHFAKYEGQLLGCDTGAIANVNGKIDCVVYFGAGMFHPLAIENDRVLVLNPVTKTVYWITEEIIRFKRRRRAMLIGALGAKRFGILVSTKIGQLNLPGALRARDELRKCGREAHILVANYIDSTAIKNFNSFDAFVNTACPRLGDDYELFEKPIVNLAELGELLKLIGDTKG